MEHYICTECGHQSEQEGVCEIPYCKNESKSLTKCVCADGLHNLSVAVNEEELDDVDIGE